MPADDRPARLLSRVYLSSQDPAMRAKAIPHLEHLDLREQNSPAYASELARLHAAAGDTEAAWRAGERAAMIAPYDADEREFAARVAIQAGQLGDARRHIAALVLLEPDRERHRQRLEAIDRMLGGG
jgi:Flp pilus assembly protein TadD